MKKKIRLDIFGHKFVVSAWIHEFALFKITNRGSTRKPRSRISAGLIFYMYQVYPKLIIIVQNLPLEICFFPPFPCIASSQPPERHLPPKFHVYFGRLPRQ
jgi:hypothetical protein